MGLDQILKFTEKKKMYMQTKPMSTLFFVCFGF